LLSLIKTSATYSAFAASSCSAVPYRQHDWTVVVIDSLLLIAARASTAGIAGITLLLVLRRRIPPSRSGHPDSAMRADEVIHEGHDFAATQNVCLWHLANIQVSSGDVRFWG
jgi:hypothetical protein